MANKALVYAIYPNEKQNIQCQKTFGCCRFVYNQMLTVQRERHETGEKHLSKTNANTYCNQHLKKEYPFLKEVDKFALTNAIYHLADGYDRFFKHLSRFPKYKSKHKAKKSYTTNGRGLLMIIILNTLHMDIIKQYIFLLQIRILARLIMMYCISILTTQNLQKKIKKK